MEKVINFIASGFFISYIPNIISSNKSKFRGCGFFGTLLSFIIYPYVISENYKFRLIFIVIFIIFSIIISEKAFSSDNEKDNPLIVIDEMAGYFTGFLIINTTILEALVLFITFRFFDTLKPFPIKEAESIKHKGTAIVMDDLIAAIYAGITTKITVYLIKSLV